MTNKKLKFIDFVISEENSSEVKIIFNDLKKFFYEVKEGFVHALVLTNKESKERWVSSTKDIKGRRKTLVRILKEKDRKSWWDPWKITFGGLKHDDIISKVDIQPYEDIEKIPNIQFIDIPIPNDQIENIKKVFKKFTLQYIKTKDPSKGIEIGQLIHDHFKSEKRQKKLRYLIELIDSKLN